MNHVVGRRQWKIGRGLILGDVAYRCLDLWADIVARANNAQYLSFTTDFWRIGL